MGAGAAPITHVNASPSLSFSPPRLSAMYAEYEDYDNGGDNEPPAKRSGGYRIEVCPNNRAKCKGESRRRVERVLLVLCAWGLTCLCLVYRCHAMQRSKLFSSCDSVSN